MKFNPTGFSHTLPNQETLSFGFGMYYGHPGNNSQFEFRASGAYIFRPLEQKPGELILYISSFFFSILMEFSNISVDLLMTDLVVNTGPLYIELHVTFESNTSATYRLCFNWVQTRQYLEILQVKTIRIGKDGNMNIGELDWLVGPISIDDGFGKEFVVKWSTLETFSQVKVVL